MTRSTLDAANRTEATAAVVRVAEFAEFAFPGGTIRCTTADRDITFGGNTYSGNAALIDAGVIGESADLKARRLAIRLSGLDSALISRILTDDYHYAAVNVWLGFFDDEGQLVADPHVLAEDLLMSGATLTLDTGSGDIELSAEYFDIFAQRDSAALCTPQSQKLRYAGDTGMDRVARLVTQEVVWGGQYLYPGQIRTPDSRDEK